jgi:hypothetical protein
MGGDMRDRITISAYSVETEKTKENPGYDQGFLNQFSNIKKIRDGLVSAAIQAKQETPEVIVSVLLIPDWDRENNSYQDQLYLEKKAAFLIAAKSKFESIRGVRVEDFYLECVMVPYARAYMHQLKAKGSNADMIKTCAIIGNAEYRRHLQIDSNTIVPSFKELYDKTFNAQEQKDGINASYYDDKYISAHNKMVYTTPNGDIARKSQLYIHLWQWCKDHMNDDNVNQDKKPKKNSIYARVFTKALRQIGYVGEHTIVPNRTLYPDKTLDPDRTIYPATLSGRVYWLTHCMTTALNMSWNDDRDKTFDHLKKLPPISMGQDGLFDFQSFFNVIKKHTGDLSIHSIALGLKDPSKKGDASRERLLRLSNSDLELQSTKKFLINVMQYSSEDGHNLLKFFKNTRHGNDLTKCLFGCSVKELPETVLKLSLSSGHSEEKSKQEEKVSARMGLR